MSSRESITCELALEFAFGVPYLHLVDEAVATDACDERDLLELGHRIFIDLGRLARGEISDIVIPPRLPRRGEHRSSV